jgi:hypothetical protein
MNHGMSQNSIELGPELGPEVQWKCPEAFVQKKIDNRIPNHFN